jgi:hypothetical protein
MPARSTSPISAACRISSSWPPATRPNSSTWSPPPMHSMTVLPPSASRAATGSASICRHSGRRWRSAGAASCAKAPR